MELRISHWTTWLCAGVRVVCWSQKLLAMERILSSIHELAFCVTTCSTELTRHSMKSHFPSSNFLLNLKKKSSNRQHPRHNAFDVNYNPLHDTWYDTEHPSSVAKKASNQFEKCLLLRPNLQGKKLLILHRAAENTSSTSSTRGYCHLPLRPR